MTARAGPALADRLRLVLVTPGEGPAERTEETVRAALDGGVTTLWLREHQLADDARAALYERLVTLARDAEALAVVSRDVDLARRCGAHGVHLGHGSPDVRTARARWPEGLLSRSAHWPLTPDDGRADWVTLSPCAPTPASLPRPLLTRAQIEACVEALAPRPVVALGGLDARRVSELPAGPAGVAVKRALTDARDPRGSAAVLRSAVDSWLTFGSSAIP